LEDELPYNPIVYKIGYWISDDLPGIYFNNMFEVVDLKTGQTKLIHI